MTDLAVSQPVLRRPAPASSRSWKLNVIGGIMAIAGISILMFGS